MSTVTAGNPVTLDAPFAQEGQTAPQAVTFEVQLPDNTIQSFVSGVDPQVTNPSGTDWRCDIGVPSEVGEYRWKAIGTASSGAETVQTIYGTVYVIPSAVAPETTVPDGPMLGPCSTWITGEDVAATVQFDGWGSDPSVFDTAAYEASMALYEISGRKFSGLCEMKVRPCRLNCPCWLGGSPSYGLGMFWWTGTPYGVGGGWWWYNERGDQLGCKPMSRVRLSGYPVREVVGVTIDGLDVPEFDPDTGFRNWRLDEWRYLTRMDIPATPPSTDATPAFWPGCQNMSLDPDQPGTFEVRYKWGVTPPQLGRDAACELAAQLFLAFNSRTCQLPAGVQKVTRQGITVERGLLANWMDTTKGTGLVHLDAFLMAYNDGERRGRDSAIYSPDLEQFARPMGTDAFLISS